MKTGDHWLVSNMQHFWIFHSLCRFSTRLTLLLPLDRQAIPERVRKTRTKANLLVRLYNCLFKTPENGLMCALINCALLSLFSFFLTRGSDKFTCWNSANAYSQRRQYSATESAQSLLSFKVLQVSTTAASAANAALHCRQRKLATVVAAINTSLTRRVVTFTFCGVY